MSARTEPAMVTLTLGRRSSAVVFKPHWRIRWRCAACAVLVVLLAGQPPVAAAPTHSDVTTVGGIAAGLSSVAVTVFTWGFGSFLEASILIHTGALWAADKVEVGYAHDPHFTQLASIVVPPSPSFVSDNLIAAAQLDAANALAQDLGMTIGAIRALDTTLNRQYSAVAAGDLLAAAQQHGHALSTLLPTLQVASNDAVDQLARIGTGFADGVLSLAQIDAYLADVHANGFPAAEVAYFNLLMATPHELMAALMALDTPDFSLQPSYSLLVDGLGNATRLMEMSAPFAESLVAAAPLAEPPVLGLVLLAWLAAAAARRRA